MLGKLIKSFLTSNEDGAPPASADSLPGPAAESPRPRSTMAYQAKTVISFVTGSRSDGLASGVHALSEIFLAQGYNYLIIDLRKDGWQERLAALIERPDEICCALSLMGIANELRIDTPGGGRALWEERGIPFLSAFGDHPAYFWDQHRNRGREFMSIYVFREHMAAARAWLRPVPAIGLLPVWARDTVGRQELDFDAKRSGKVFFFKNGNDPQALLHFWKTLPQPVSGWLFEIVHGIDIFKVGHGEHQLHALVRSFLQDRDFNPAAPSGVEVFLTAQIDDYARRMKSTRVAEALLDLPVQVFGDNWGHVDFTGRRARHSEGRSYFDTRGLINQALSVMDMSPNTESAPHERFMGAIGRHTLCLNNTQKYYLENYPDAAEMLFDFDPQSIAQRVADVIARPAHYVDLGVAVAERARQIHPAAKVVEYLADCARMMRFSESTAPFDGQQNFVIWPPEQR